jgi:hypothetical protein
MVYLRKDSLPLPRARVSSVSDSCVRREMTQSEKCLQKLVLDTVHVPVLDRVEHFAQERFFLILRTGQHIHMSKPVTYTPLFYDEFSFRNESRLQMCYLLNSALGYRAIIGIRTATRPYKDHNAPAKEERSNDTSTNSMHLNSFIRKE